MGNGVKVEAKDVLTQGMFKQGEGKGKGMYSDWDLWFNLQNIFC